MTSNHAPERASSGTLAQHLDRIGFSRAQFWVLALILAGMFFDTLEQNSVGAMGANLKLALGITDTQLTTINTATVIGGLVGRLAGGWLADRYGRRASLSINLLLYTLGGLLSAVALNYEMMLASRFVVGIGLGGEFTIGIAMLAEMVATRHRGTLVATLNIGSGGVGNFLSYGLFFLLLGPLAPALGGDHLVWRWTFLLLAFPALLVVLYRRRLPETPRFLLSKGRVEEANRSLAILASNSLTPATGAAPDGPLTTADIPERQLSSSPAAVFARSVLARTVSIGVASWMAFGVQVTLNFLMPTLLVERGYSISESLLFTMIMNLGSLVGSCAAAWLAGRVGRRSAVGGAGVLGCVTAAAFAMFGDTTTLILILGGLFQFFTMITNTTLAVWSPELYPTSIRANGTSIVNGIGNIAGAVMPFLAVALFGAFGFAGVFGMAAVMYALLVLATRFAPETRARTLEQINEDSPRTTLAA
ncbi:MFS transporter [Saccharopolyspora flava]|uniref:MFS transporter, putative metabolite:H+ symporter n=1 Tax=Saccharopolyspora flava TaxID=95161 RepID=A0A1I6RKT1_9PSEU|nr:MFS transporter [Saccharopolyspora flava]SFS65292.1 MFS transporter, putative metabolite:H+ symporter [Saccharopolyspora flava]